MIFALKKEIFMIFEYNFHRKRYMERYMDPKCVLALMITEICKLERLIINSHCMVATNNDVTTLCDLCNTFVSHDVMWPV